MLGVLLSACTLPESTECPRLKELLEERARQLEGFVRLGQGEIERYASSVECLGCHPGAGRRDYTGLRPEAEFLRRPPSGTKAASAFPPFSYNPDSIVCYGCHAEADLLQVPNPDAQMIEMNDYISTVVYPGWSLPAGEWRTDFRGDAWQDDDVSNGGYDAGGQWVVSTGLTSTVLEDLNANGGLGWTVDQWVDYVLVPDDQSPLNRYTIVSNTATAVTVQAGSDMVADGAQAGDRYRIEVYYPVVGTKVYNVDSQDSNFHYDHMIRYPLIYGTWFEVTCVKCHAVDPVTLLHEDTGHPGHTRVELDFAHIDRDLQVGGADEGGWANVDFLHCLTVCHPQTSSPEPANAYHRDERAVVPGGSECLGCHDQERGSRRQIGGTGGDFDRPHHHVVGSVQNEDCTVCHYVGNHGSGTVKVKDVDTGGTIDFTSDAALLPHCLSCHDADGANGNVTPFSDGVTVPDIERGGLWAASAHATGGTTNAGYSCFGDGSTTGCHGNAHGSNLRKLLSPYDGTPGVDNVNEEEGFCYTCHGPTVVMNEAVSNGWIGGVYENFSSNIEEVFGLQAVHPVNDSAPGHTFDPGTGPVELECTSCHGVHQNTGRYWAAGSGVTPVDLFATGELWGDDPDEKIGVFDPAHVYQAPSLGDPGNDLSGNPLPIDASGNSLLTDTVLPDYNRMCLSCHQAAFGGVIAIDFSANKHGSAEAEPEGPPDNPTGFPLAPPFDTASRGQYYLACTDCHEGHGSANEWLIRRTQNGDLATEIITETTTTGWKYVCDACHASDPQARHHNQDVYLKLGMDPNNPDCNRCHFSHGSPYINCVSSGCHGHGDIF